MKRSYVVGGAVLAVVVLFMNLNLFKTIYLIAQVTPAYEQKGSGDRRILILGDSTGYGTGAKRSTESIAGLIGATYPDVTIINNSRNGRTASELRGGLSTLEGSYDIILLQIGANDLLQHEPPAQIVAEIENIVSILKQHTERVIVMTGSNIGGAARFEGQKKKTYTDRSREFDQLMTRAAAESGQFQFVTLFEEPGVDPFVLHPEINTSCDGLHPTSAGYALWYADLEPILKANLEGGLQDKK